MPCIDQLLDAIDASLASATDAVLATVVKVQGSAYRRPGARMVIPRVGNPSGTVSGGCLESEVARKAWWLSEQGPKVVAYSTAEDEDEPQDEAAFNFGLGCNGTVFVLMERLEGGAQSLLLSTLRQVRDSGQASALATVIASDGPVPVGARRVVGGEALVSPALSEQVQHSLGVVLRQGKSALRRYRGEWGEVEVFLEYLPPPQRLVVFGAGHDVQPLVRMACELGWRVTVVDGRAHFARAERFPLAEAVICAPAGEPLPPALKLDGAAVAIMTHSLTQDFHWLQAALASQATYIGQLGPRDRTQRLLADMNPSRLAALPRLHYPMGLDLGGDSPESVAMAILAEIVAVFNGRQGGPLNRREQAIHDVEPSVLHD
ncbi:xanthine dehydrogenase accessory factor [Pseudomonas sp. M47T1]|uniref:XdhC family protein n=2 Tax=unclassified Pseudomonas TaxID=196821 RepID=UPI0002607B06|nr:XdhC family protein [Pseudomonas sp. M47T1]EIK97167.1 xanthine dehydrogenase accessory factor [Pseudomonas sp. M47T1]